MHRALYMIAFPAGHLAVDWPGAAVWLLAPAIAVALDLSPGEVGLLITIHALGASLAYLPAGLLGDHVRRRGLLLAATFWWVVLGYLAASWSPDFWTLGALLAVGGLGSAAWHPIATGVLVQHMPSRRAQVLGIHALGGTLAEVGAPLAAGFLLAVLDWRSVLQLSILPAVLMGVVFLRLARAVPDAQSHGVSQADVLHLWNVWRQPAGLRLLAAVVAYNMALMAVMSMTPLFMQLHHGYTASQTGLLFAAMLLAGSLLQPVLGRLSDELGRRGIITAGVSAAMLSAGAVAVIEHSGGIALLLVTTVALLVGVRAAILAVMVEATGRSESTTLGLAFAIMDGVGALGALLAGLAASLDLRYAFVFAAFAAAGCVFLSMRGALMPVVETPT